MKSFRSLLGFDGVDYVSDKALSNLKYYKYGSIDLSYLSFYILQPYWSWVITSLEIIDCLSVSNCSLCGLHLI